MPWLLPWEGCLWSEIERKPYFFPYSDIRSIRAWEKLFLGAHLEGPDASLKDTETHTELKPTSDAVPLSPKRETPAFVTFESSAKHLLWHCKGPDSDLSGTGGDLKHLLFSHSAQATHWVWQCRAKGEKVRAALFEGACWWSIHLNSSNQNSPTTTEGVAPFHTAVNCQGFQHKTGRCFLSFYECLSLL